MLPLCEAPPGLEGLGLRFCGFQGLGPGGGGSRLLRADKVVLVGSNTSLRVDLVFSRCGLQSSAVFAAAVRGLSVVAGVHIAMVVVLEPLLLLLRLLLVLQKIGLLLVNVCSCRFLFARVANRKFFR